MSEDALDRHALRVAFGVITLCALALVVGVLGLIVSDPEIAAGVGFALAVLAVAWMVGRTLEVAGVIEI